MKKIATMIGVLVTLLMQPGISQDRDASDQSPTAIGKFQVGLRFGIATSITGRVFLDDQTAIEGLISMPIFDTRVGVTGLYEKFGRFGNPGLGVFYGVGAHAEDYTREFVKNNHTYGGLIFGVDGIVGIDYTFPFSPINLSLDWKPAIDVIPLFGNPAPLLEFGASIRYIF
ncbi:MAG TPA: hypothetical protein VMV20_05710 [Chitinophagaceae bacterium]|nr:hypothetical protein [Chitinophagaceae bacterium]